LGKYSTISVPVRVRKVLEEAKGEEEWGDFLLGLYMESRRLKSKEAFEKLAKVLTEEELNRILESSEEFKKGFELR
jgi:hypothetical protein